MKIFALRIPYRDTVDVPVAIITDKDLERAKNYLIAHEKEFNTDWKNAELLWYRSLADAEIGPNLLGIYFN